VAVPPRVRGPLSHPNPISAGNLTDEQRREAVAIAMAAGEITSVEHSQGVVFAEAPRWRGV
jgi:hypothetical protein